VGNSSGKIAGLLLTLLLVGSSELFSQSTTADILGTVTDQTGAVLAGATVKVTSLATGEVRTVNSNDHGDYVVNSLLPAHYKVEVICAVSRPFQCRTSWPRRANRRCARGCFAGNRRSDRDSGSGGGDAAAANRQLDPGNDGGGEVGARDLPD